MDPKKSEAEKKLWISRPFPRMLNLHLALMTQMLTGDIGKGVVGTLKELEIMENRR